MQRKWNTNIKLKWIKALQNMYGISVRSSVNYLFSESDGAIDMHYAYLFTLQGGVTTNTKACAVLGHKFADLIEAEKETETMR